MNIIQKIGTQNMLLAFFLTLITLSHPLIVSRFGHDVVMYFDYMYRVSHGLRPGSDIWTVYGSLPFIVMAEFASYFGYSVYLILLFNALVLLIYLPFYIRSGSVKKWQFIFLVPMIMGIYHLGDIHAITYANFYNRVGLFVFLFVLIFGHKNKNSKLLDCYVGVSLFILLNLKPTFFGLALLFMAVYRFRRFVYWGAALLGLELIYFLFFDSSLFSYMHIAKQISGVYSSILKINVISYFRGENFSGSELSSAPIFGFTFSTYSSLFFCVFLPFLFVIKKEKISLIARILFSNLLILAVQFLNYLPSNDALVIFNLCVLLESYSIEREKRWANLTLVLITPLILSVFFNNFYSMIINHQNTLKYHDKLSQFSNIKGLKILRADGALNENYLAVHRNGLELVNFCKKNYSTCNSLLVVAFEDSISSEAQLQPRYTMLPIHFNFNFNNKTHPNPERLFEGLNFIIVRSKDENESNLPFKKLYAQEIAKFKTCHRNDDWILLCRN
jgi:hypothetical protein